MKKICYKAKIKAEKAFINFMRYIFLYSITKLLKSITVYFKYSLF